MPHAVGCDGRLSLWPFARGRVAHGLAEIGCVTDCHQEHVARFRYFAGEISHHVALMIERPEQAAPLLPLTFRHIDFRAFDMRDQHAVLDA